jgi:hypothetical protein
MLRLIAPAGLAMLILANPSTGYAAPTICYETAAKISPAIDQLWTMREELTSLQNAIDLLPSNEAGSVISERDTVAGKMEEIRSSVRQAIDTYKANDCIETQQDFENLQRLERVWLNRKEGQQ